jgi:hypothetical protein
MGNKSFESKLNNAAHNYVNGRHVPIPHPDQNEKIYRNANKQFDKDLNENKYNESVKNIPQKDRDRYSDKMKSENPSWDK